MNHVLLVCTLCIAGTSVAQPVPQPLHLPSAADPLVGVPPAIYRSVFKETSLGVETEVVDWRKANDDVGKFTRGHVDILKAEEKEGATKPVAAPGHKH